MPTARATRPASRPLNKRGSPEAIEKRRVARAFNEVLGGDASAARLDGRTAKRRQRLLEELASGKTQTNKALKPLDVLTRVQELLALGEPLSNVKKARKPRKPVAKTAATVELVRRLHAAYGFETACYAFVGVGDDILAAARVLSTRGASRPKRRA
jgi:hypothetical protein